MSATGFFNRQARAKRNTGWLVVLFMTAVVLITLAVCVVGYTVTRSDTTSMSFFDWLSSYHGLMTALAVTGLIGVGSLIRWIDLAGGGERVAKMVNARLIDPTTQDTEERRLRNIVEEMAIASGVPVPQLYVMDHEVGINAFVAGYAPTEAVMVVTHGALTNLNRDELQGVVGHEFSHILNGDMRLNVRLIALLAGILMISQVGAFLLHSSNTRSSYGTSRGGKERGLALLLGLALTVIGYVGVFFGRLIQAAVSRQREMLADASSVQFTRNPEGIGGALFKIGFKNSYLKTTSHASDMNHMCFGESARMRLSSLLASHPPIADRINAIQPGLLARLKSRMRDTVPARKTGLGAGQASPLVSAGFEGDAKANVQGITSPFTTTAPDTPSSHTGQLTGAGEHYAQHLLQQMPATFRELLYTRTGSIQLCYALLVYGLSDTARDQCLALATAPYPFEPQPDLLSKLMPALSEFEGALNFPALELAMPALRQLDPDEAHTLIKQVYTLIRADGRVSLFEYSLASFLQRHLSSGSSRVTPVKYRSYRGVQDSLITLFGLIARASNSAPDQADALFRQTMAGFVERGESSTRLPDKITIRDLQKALTELNALSPLLKPAIIDACAQGILSDRKVTVQEYDILRLVADQLDCPMPPLLMPQPLPE
ncbi:M48 family metallopeptidase [Marinobacter caseinilyticus]|uniref:M48 family metallopeptidase n=1 Tax=Marinobacter caseinilyticus TaxID=2692195 RepID=UPI00140DA53D|nr:M48 family metallopeptidase [Marinobacter caseinilyticus]